MRTEIEMSLILCGWHLECMCCTRKCAGLLPSSRFVQGHTLFRVALMHIHGRSIRGCPRPRMVTISARYQLPRDTTTMDRRDRHIDPCLWHWRDTRGQLTLYPVPRPRTPAPYPDCRANIPATKRRLTHFPGMSMIDNPEIMRRCE